MANSAAEWKTYLEELLKKPSLRQQLGRQAHKEVLERAQPTKVAQQFAYIIKKVVGQKATPAFSLTQRHIHSYLHHYYMFTKDHDTRPQPYTWQYFLSVVKRGIDYIEYRISNA